MLRPCAFVPLALVLLLTAKSTASADLTAFVGATTDPGTRATRGVAVGAGLIIVGFEFEYAHAGGDAEDEPACISATATDQCQPSLTTGMGNVLLQTPRGLGPMQVYGTVGGGLYRERYSVNDETDTSFGTNVGGGVKINLFGPLRVRLDYRIFRLTGDTLNKTPKRFYAGANLAF
jgi:opacity protein-like surface antigen